MDVMIDATINELADKLQRLLADGTTTYAEAQRIFHRIDNEVWGVAEELVTSAPDYPDEDEGDE
jgi:hypothetical protein